VRPFHTGWRAVKTPRKGNAGPWYTSWNITDPPPPDAVDLHVRDDLVEIAWWYVSTSDYGTTTYSKAHVLTEGEKPLCKRTPKNQIKQRDIAPVGWSNDACGRCVVAARKLLGTCLNCGGAHTVADCERVALESAQRARAQWEANHA